MKKATRTPTKKTAAPKAAQPVIGLHSMAYAPGAHKRKKLLGRGPSSGHGKTSTRGSKGQTSRSGPDFYAGFEGGQTPMIRRMPKRGFTSTNRRVYQIINLEQISRIKADAVTPELLLQKKLIKNTFLPVKILGDGEITHPVTIKAHAFSKSAQEKLMKSGSQFEVLPYAS